MVETSKCTIRDVIEVYDMATEAECRDGLYELTGRRRPVKAVLGPWCHESDAECEVTTGLQGWSDYTDFVTLRTGGGNLSFMARRR